MQVLGIRSHPHRERALLACGLTVPQSPQSALSATPAATACVEAPCSFSGTGTGTMTLSSEAEFAVKRQLTLHLTASQRQMSGSGDEATIAPFTLPKTSSPLSY